MPFIHEQKITKKKKGNISKHKIMCYVYSNSKSFIHCHYKFFFVIIGLDHAIQYKFKFEIQITHICHISQNESISIKNYHPINVQKVNSNSIPT